MLHEKMRQFLAGTAGSGRRSSSTHIILLLCFIIHLGLDYYDISLGFKLINLYCKFIPSNLLMHPKTIYLVSLALIYLTYFIS